MVKKPKLRKPVKSWTPVSIHDRLLFSRKEAAYLLGGTCTHFMRSLEDAGKIKPVKLFRGARTRVFYRRADLMKLAGVEEEGSPVVRGRAAKT